MLLDKTTWVAISISPLTYGVTETHLKQYMTGNVELCDVDVHIVLRNRIVFGLDID